MGFIHKTGNTQEVLVNGAVEEHPVPEGFVYSEGSPPEGYFMAVLEVPESFEKLARRVLDESASVPMLVQLAPILPSVLLFAQAGTAKGAQAALAILSGIPLPSELEDERTLLIQKLGG